MVDGRCSTHHVLQNWLQEEESTRNPARTIAALYYRYRLTVSDSRSPGEGCCPLTEIEVIFT